MSSLSTFVLKFVLKIILFVPHKVLNVLSKIIGIIFFYIIPIRKKVVKSNLKKAFPNLSEKDISNLAYRCYLSISQTFIEIIKLKSVSIDWLIDKIKFENEELLEKHLAKKESLILLTAHFGNWEYGAITVGAKYNFSMNVLAKRQSSEFVTDFMTSVRSQFGNKEIFTGSSVKELYKALLNKQVIGVVGDQRGAKQGPRVKFFDQETAIYTGTATMSLKTNTPILVILVARQKDYSFKAYIEEISFDDLPENQEDKILEINQRYFNILEKTIRKYPEQWFWMHKIWKY